ncbi:MarR family transcriptional regulator [Chelativorans sp. M5D2P16]|uniref:MarR family winged helix-turn-helix transcriptional regulator n=1 Tax=Chelativorans sp. M5D2P16 TaxID=3095678 RepID=UPI002ACAFB8D|nr:MarR family transcriptional regulator [Chelativorans sp. M5D2P16]MDZ5700112.1 MarR family transcriptional regulator [Chelativorans sp. M5D2P16]
MAQPTDNVQTLDRFPPDELRLVEKSIRRILRASDLQSKALVKAIGLTAPQLVILKAIAALGEVTTTALSEHADLSAATVVTILDNLEVRGLVERYRSPSDRRVVHARLTPTGGRLVQEAPEPLGVGFARRFQRLDPAERLRFIEMLNDLADMMEPAIPASRTRNGRLL